MRKVLSILLALVMLLSVISFTVAAEGETTQNFIDGGFGFIGSHIDVSSHWAMWTAFPNMTLPLGQGQWDVYVDPAVWDSIVSGAFIIDYSDYADAIEFLGQADRDASGSIYATFGSEYIAPGVVWTIFNAWDMNMMPDNETGYLGWVRFSFELIDFDRLQYHLLNSPNNMLEIDIRLGNSAMVESAGGYYDVGGRLAGWQWDDVSVEFWRHFDNADPSTFAILEPITIGRNMTVTFDANGGTSESATQTVLFGGRAIAPTHEPTKGGYNFRYWAVDDGSGNLVPWNFENSVLDNMTLIAVWSRVGTARHTVAFDARTGNLADNPPNQSILEGMRVIRPTSNPEKAGYVFDGWFIDDGVGNLIPWNFNDLVNKDMTLLAAWAQGNIEILIPPGVGDGLAGFKILRGRWAEETTATISFLVRIDNSVEESVFLSNLDRISLTAASSQGFQLRTGTATPNLILTHGSLDITAANIGNVVIVNGVQYREINLEITDALKSGIVDFTLNFATEDNSATLASAIHRVLIPGDVNKDAQVNSLDHAVIFMIMEGDLGMDIPQRMAAGEYFFELADINVDGQINSIDHAIIFNMMRGIIPTN